MEAVFDHRRAKQELDLAACHSDRYLIDYRFFQQVALLNIDSKNTGAKQQRGCEDAGSENGTEKGQIHGGAHG